MPCSSPEAWAATAAKSSSWLDPARDELGHPAQRRLLLGEVPQPTPRLRPRDGRGHDSGERGKLLLGAARQRTIPRRRHEHAPTPPLHHHGNADRGPHAPAPPGLPDVHHREVVDPHRAAGAAGARGDPVGRGRERARRPESRPPVPPGRPPIPSSSYRTSMTGRFPRTRDAASTSCAKTTSGAAPRAASSVTCPSSARRARGCGTGAGINARSPVGGGRSARRGRDGARYRQRRCRACGRSRSRASRRRPG